MNSINVDWLTRGAYLAVFSLTVRLIREPLHVLISGSVPTYQH